MKKTPVAKKRSAGRPSHGISGQVDDAVLAAAASVFQEDGFSSASMQAIAERACVTRQTLYRRFANKTLLYQALMEARTEELLSLLSVVLNENEPPDVALERFGVQLLSTYISSDLQQLHRMAISESNVFPHLAKAFFSLGPDRGKRLLQGYLEAQVRSRSLAIPNVELAAEQFVGALVGTVVIRSTLAQPQPLTDVAKQHAWVKAAVIAFLSAYRLKKS